MHVQCCELRLNTKNAIAQQIGDKLRVEHLSLCNWQCYEKTRSKFHNKLNNLLVFASFQNHLQCVNINAEVLFANV